jgi:hypothetical protein
MIEPEDWNRIAKALAAANGLSLDEAEEVLAEIGDTPQLDDEGRAVVNGRAYVLP